MKKVAYLATACVLLAALGIAACAGGEHAPPTARTVEWGYDGAGAPGNWASLSEEYALCTEGQRQSPINITGYQEADSEPIVFLYDSNATGVRNDGRFVHVDYPPGQHFEIGPVDLQTEVGPPSFTIGTSDRRHGFCG